MIENAKEYLRIAKDYLKNKPYKTALAVVIAGMTIKEIPYDLFYCLDFSPPAKVHNLIRDYGNDSVTKNGTQYVFQSGLPDSHLIRLEVKKGENLIELVDYRADGLPSEINAGSFSLMDPLDFGDDTIEIKGIRKEFHELNPNIRKNIREIYQNALDAAKEFYGNKKKERSIKHRKLREMENIEKIVESFVNK